MGERGEERGGEAILGGDEAGGAVSGSETGQTFVGRRDRHGAEFKERETEDCERMSEEETEGGEETDGQGDAAGSGDVAN